MVGEAPREEHQRRIGLGQHAIPGEEENPLGPAARGDGCPEPRLDADAPDVLEKLPGQGRLRIGDEHDLCVLHRLTQPGKVGDREPLLRRERLVLRYPAHELEPHPLRVDPPDLGDVRAQGAPCFAADLEAHLVGRARVQTGCGAQDPVERLPPLTLAGVQASALEGLPAEVGRDGRDGVCLVVDRLGIVVEEAE